MVPKQMGVRRKGVLALAGKTVSLLCIQSCMYEYYNPELKEDFSSVQFSRSVVSDSWQPHE